MVRLFRRCTECESVLVHGHVPDCERLPSALHFHLQRYPFVYRFLVVPRVDIEWCTGLGVLLYVMRDEAEECSRFVGFLLECDDICRLGDLTDKGIASFVAKGDELGDTMSFEGESNCF